MVQDDGTTSPPNSSGKTVTLTITLDVGAGKVTYALANDYLLTMQLLTSAMTEALNRELAKRVAPAAHPGVFRIPSIGARHG